MDYEKLYKEALDRAKDYHKQLLDEDNPEWAGKIENIFPELQESDDEKIRKWLIGYFHQYKEDGMEVVYTSGFKADDIIAWLEKQKPIEHFELKAGNWYICHRPFCCRADHLTVKEGEKFMCEKDGVAKGFIIEDPEKYFKETVPPAPYEDEQGEQKPVDNVEPKFKLEHGKWYRCILTPVVHKYFTVGKVYKCELEGCLVDDINEDRIVDLDLECFRPATEDEIPQEKSEVKVAIADLETPQDPILIRLDKIFDVLTEIKINTVLRQPYITSDPPQPIQPWYETETVTCGEQASTETTTNTIEDERPETTM